MYESYRSVRPSWIAFGWFIAAALTALVLVVLEVFRVISMEGQAQGPWVPLALALGFGTAGFFVGTRVNAAPILHGVGMGLFTVLVWLALNLFLGEPTGATAWNVLSAQSAGGALLTTTAAAVVGARMGVRYARRF